MYLKVDSLALLNSFNQIWMECWLEKGYVLENENAGWTSDAVQKMVATNETQSIGLKKTIHVHQLYWTAWMDKDGLQFRPDIYKLDKILYDKLSRKS